MKVSDKDIAEARKLIQNKGVIGLSANQLLLAAKELEMSTSEALNNIIKFISGESGGLFPEYKEVVKLQQSGGG